MSSEPRHIATRYVAVDCVVLMMVAKGESLKNEIQILLSHLPQPPKLAGRGSIMSGIVIRGGPSLSKNKNIDRINAAYVYFAYDTNLQHFVPPVCITCTCPGHVADPITPCVGNDGGGAAILADQSKRSVPSR